MESKRDNSKKELQNAVLQLLDDDLNAENTPAREEGIKTDIRQVMGGGWTMNTKTNEVNPLDISELLTAASIRLPRLMKPTKEGIKEFMKRYEEYQLLAPASLKKPIHMLVSLSVLRVVALQANCSLSDVKDFTEEMFIDKLCQIHEAVKLDEAGL